MCECGQYTIVEGKCEECLKRDRIRKEKIKTAEDVADISLTFLRKELSPSNRTFKLKGKWTITLEEIW